MTEAAARTPEQDATVRRRAVPFALGGLICAAAGMALLVTKVIDETHPPAIFAVNLSFCGMMIGIGMLFYVRRTPGTRLATAASILAVLLGIAGTFVYTRQAFDLRVAMKNRELGNLTAIFNASKQYAGENGGEFPANLDVLLDQHRIRPTDLHSPYGNGETMDQRKKLPPAEFEKWYARHSDYQYLGIGLRLPAATTAPAGTQPASGLPPAIVIASGFEPILRNSITVVFADGRADFLNLEEVQAALKTSNEAREKLGLPAIRPPESVRRAQELERREKGTGG